MREPTRGFLSGAGLALLLMAGTWFAPLEFETASSKARTMIGVFNTVFQPMIDLAGKGPLLGILGTVAIVCLAFGIGLQLPALPGVRPDLARSRRERPEPEETDDQPATVRRRRDFSALAAAEQAPPSVLPEIPPRPEEQVDEASPDIEPHTAGGGNEEPANDPQPPAENPFATERAAVEYLAACHGSNEHVTRDAMLQSFRQLRGPEAELDDTLYEKAVALVREQQRRATPHALHLDPVILVRKPRERARDWSGDRSWFGGLPRLGGAAWPRGADGVPLPFAAQIDLAEIAAVCPGSPLPHEGSLAFFLNSGAVVHVPPGDHAPTPAPAGLPAAFDEGSYPFPERPARTNKALFPFWPVEPVALPMPDDCRDFADEEHHEEIYAAQHRLLAERVPTRQYAFSVYSAREAGIASADRLWWYGALHLEDRLRDALDGVDRAVALREEWIEQARGYQAKLAAAAQPDENAIAASKANEERSRAQIPDIRRQGEELAVFLENFAGFTAGRAPWDELGGEEISLLEEVLNEVRARFPDLRPMGMPSGLDDLRNLCIRRMVTGEAEALAALPDDMLAFVNEGYRLSSQDPHQMFGLAGVKQSNLYDHLCDLLLLQLSYDDANEWRFGDMGLWHFWISPEDAAAGRWDKAELTFECS